MEIPSALTILKGAVGGLLGLVGTHYRKPFYQWVKKMIQVMAKVDKLELRMDEVEVGLSISKSVQMADFHTDQTPTFIVNVKGELIYANIAWVRLLEYGYAERAYGMRFMDIIHPDDFKRVEKIHNELLHHPIAFDEMIKLQTKVTKTEINTLCVSELVYDKNNVLIKTIGRLYVLDT